MNSVLPAAAALAARPGGRRPSFGLVVALVVLALPVAAAIWAVGDLAARHAVTEADGRLAAALRAGAAEARDLAAAAELDARRLAARPAVQEALARSDRAALAEVEARRPGIELLPAGDTARRAGGPALRREVRVERAGRHVGTVAATVALDAALLRELGAARDDGDVRLALAFADGTVLVAGGERGGVTGGAGERPVIAIAGSAQRAVSARILRSPEAVSLVAATPESAVAAAQRNARLLVLLAGLVTIAGVILIAYLLAPAIVRARLARHRRETAATVLERVGDGICLVDEEGVIRFWNPAAEAITGLPTDAVRDRPAEDAVPGWPSLAGALGAEVVAHGGAPAHGVTLPLEIHGRELWLSISAVGFPGGTVYAFRDLTEERRLEEMRTELVSTVSHELRTPLASVRGAALTLLRRDAVLAEGTRDDLLAVIADESQRLARIADGMLLASQLAAGRPSLREEPFEPETPARAVVEAARAEAPQGVSIELLVREPLPRVAADSERVRQVLAGLVENAVKYSPEGGRIEVRVEAADSGVRFSVRDEGIGIPPGEQERIFEKFYRLDPDLTRGVGGPGLGLYICRELVRYMDGRIAVESQPGHGSTFTVEFPAAGEQAAA